MRLELKLLCQNCKSEVIRCEECREIFREMDFIICTQGKHFCSQECLSDYLINEYKKDNKMMYSFVDLDVHYK